ncbi:MAG: C-terminal binding protein [Haloferacaceae archaeon]
MRVLVTDRKWPEREDPYGDVARDAGAEIEYADFERYEEVREGCRDADVILTSKAPLTREVIEGLENTRSIIRLGTGVDTINLKAATEYGIPVSNVPGLYCAEELASHAIGLMLAAAHEIVLSDRAVREGPGWGRREDVNPMNQGTFGIVGLGHIGRAAVRKAQGLDMDVIAYDPYLADDLFEPLGVERVEFAELLARADCVSVHTPLTAETHHLFSTEEFAAMKEIAVLVNTARGPIVDEAALVEAVEAGTIWGAGLDVFETEPPEDSPALGCERIVCSPHHGGSCERSGAYALRSVREELRRALTGEHLRNVVNPGALQYSDELFSPELEEWT